MKKALITGITGQDGYYLSEFLLAKGYEVHGFARRGSHMQDKRIQLHEGDLSDPAAIIRALEASRPDEIYNLGAQSHVGASFKTPGYTMMVTGMPILTILEWVRSCTPVRNFGDGIWPNIKVYQASTSELFGNRLPPHNEQTPFEPRSPYGVAKLAAHHTVKVYREAYNIFACSGILHNHESVRRSPDFVTRKISLAVARIKHGLQESVTLGNMLAIRDWGWAPDYVEAMWMMMQQDLPRDFVIATGEGHTVQEFFELAVEAAGLPLPWTAYLAQSPNHYRPAEVNCLKGDASDAAAVLGWKPKTTFKEIVKLMVEADLEGVGEDLAKL